MKLRHDRFFQTHFIIFRVNDNAIKKKIDKFHRLIVELLKYVSIMRKFWVLISVLTEVSARLPSNFSRKLKAIV